MPLRYRTNELEDQDWLDKVEQAAGRLGDIFCNERLWEAVAIVEISLVLVALTAMGLWWAVDAIF